MASNATQCGLFAYEIFIHIASELGIKHNLFQTFTGSTRVDYFIIFQFLCNKVCLDNIQNLYLYS